MTYCLLFIGSW